MKAIGRHPVIAAVVAIAVLFLLYVTVLVVFGESAGGVDVGPVGSR